jgi:hypothetical protein
LFCAKQGIALRGAGENNESSTGEGNFLALFRLLGRYNEAVMQRLEELPGNSKLLAPKIQNDLLLAACEYAKEKTRKDLGDGHYALLVDELKDQSKKELLGVTIRYVSHSTAKPTVKEVTIALLELTDLTAEGLTKAITSVVTDAKLDPTRCVGFASDGAAVMSGKHGGVQTLLRNRLLTSAEYVHCANHRLNLALVKAAKAIAAVRNFFDQVVALSTFFHAATRHDLFVKVQQRKKERVMEIDRPTDTRWLSKGGAISKIRQRFGSIVEALEAVVGRQKDDRLVAEGLLSGMLTKEFVSHLLMWGKVLEQIDSISTGLQRKENTAIEAKRFIVVLRHSLDDLDSKATALEAEVESMCDAHCVEVWAPRAKRGRGAGAESFRRDVWAGHPHSPRSAPSSPSGSTATPPPPARPTSRTPCWTATSAPTERRWSRWQRSGDWTSPLGTLIRRSSSSNSPHFRHETRVICSTCWSPASTSSPTCARSSLPWLHSPSPRARRSGSSPPSAASRRGFGQRW